MQFDEKYDVVVVGAGHAGCEGEPLCRRERSGSRQAKSCAALTRSGRGVEGPSRATKTKICSLTRNTMWWWLALVMRDARASRYAGVSAAGAGRRNPARP